jgi:D-alanine--poly(phosphoribitol) ligase subunit 1
MESLASIVKTSCTINQNKIAFSDEKTDISYEEFNVLCSSIGTSFIKNKVNKVCILLNKSVKVVASMFSSVYAGAVYVILDATSPKDRLDKIVSLVVPDLIICEDKTCELAKGLAEVHHSKVALYEDLIKTEASPALLEAKDKETKPDDLVYILFTSGSTGIPKGVMINQRNIISYMGWFTKCFNIDSDTVFGNQTPFYFSMSVSDVYATVFTGATLNIIPQICFSFPIKLVEFLNQRKINTIYWVPSVFAIIDFFKIFDYALPQYLKTVLFAGEVMQMKDLNYFRSKLPHCLYANLFGPTETTDICTYYKVNREFKDSDSLPIGVECEGLHCYLINEQGKECSKGEEGELYAEGPFVSPGYYKNEEKTEATFVQSPLNKECLVKAYKTGDLCKVNEYGEYMFTGRADFQIKHMGYRIELGEIEAILLKDHRVMNCCAVYDVKEDKIVLIYCGKVKEDEALSIIKDGVPYYMVPSTIIKTPMIKYNQNGKIDRKWYGANYQTLIKK